MSSFPSGCCSFASNLLNKHLLTYGIDTNFVSGRYGYGSHSEKHEWLETMDEIVIDITGDQFKYKEPKFTKPVYVGIRANGFHDQFKLDDQTFCSLCEDPFSGDFGLDGRYQRIMAYYENG